MADHPVARLMRWSLLSQFALLLSGPLVVRLIGVESRGEVALVFAVTACVGQLGALGVPAAIAYYIASHRSSGRAMLARFGRGYAVQVVVLGALAAGVMAVLAATGSHLDHRVTEIVIAGVGTAIILVVVLGYACLQGEHRFAVLARIQALPALFYAAAVVVLMLLDVRDVVPLLVLYYLGWVGSAALAIGLVLAGSAPDHQEPVKVSGRDLGSYAMRATTAAAAPVDNLNLDQIMIGVILGHTSLGLYAIGYAFETAPVFALVAVASVVTTRIASQTEGRRALARIWLIRGALIGVLIVGAIQLVIEPVTVWAFGQEAEPAVPVGRILVLAGLLLGLRRVGAAALLGLGLPGRSTAAEVLGLVVLVVGVPLGAWWADVEGAAWSLVCAGAVVLVAQIVMIRFSAARPVPDGSVPPLDAR